MLVKQSSYHYTAYRHCQDCSPDLLLTRERKRTYPQYISVEPTRIVFFRVQFVVGQSTQGACTAHCHCQDCSPVLFLTRGETGSLHSTGLLTLSCTAIDTTMQGPTTTSKCTTHTCFLVGEVSASLACILCSAWRLFKLNANHQASSNESPGVGWRIVAPNRRTPGQKPHHGSVIRSPDFLLQ